MVRKMCLALACVTICFSTAYADEEAPAHLFDDLNADGQSDGVARGESDENSQTPSQATEDADQTPVLTDQPDVAPQEHE